MDTTQHHDEELRQLFKQLPVEKPSVNFAAQVMMQVAFEKQKATNRKQIRLIAWAVSIPCSIAVLLIVGFFTRPYWEIFLRQFFEPLYLSLKHTLSSLNKTIASIAEIFSGNSSMIFLTGFLLLALLLGDLFFRKYVLP